jgi:hypothetical protein
MRSQHFERDGLNLPEKSSAPPAIQHENVRGPGYYKDDNETEEPIMLNQPPLRLRALKLDGMVKLSKSIGQSGISGMD